MVTDPLIPRAESKSGGRSARLICDCGKKYVSPIRLLVGSNNRIRLSCGCLGNENRGATMRNNPNTIIDLTGHRFGKLTVLERVASKVTGPAGDAGVIAVTGPLSRQRTSPERDEELRLPGAHASSSPWGSRKKQPVSRISAKLLAGNSAGSCRTMASAGSRRRIASTAAARLQRRPYSARPYIYNGVDRVDNGRGYTLDNSVAAATSATAPRWIYLWTHSWPGSAA